MLDDFKPQERLFPMPGIEIWKNPKNKFCVMEIHYTADPAKRSPQWKEDVSASMPRRDFLREYEISWETWEGLPVYTDFDVKIHGIQGHIEPHLGLPLLRGWDFGLTPACIVAQVQEQTLCAIKEFVGFNIGIERFSDMVLTSCAQLFPRWRDTKRDWLDFIDPSGFAKKDTDEKSCAQILTGPGKNLRVQAGEITFTKRRQSVESFLTRRYKNRNCFEVSLSDCPMLVRGFKGGYQYPEHSADMTANELRPEKNEFSHIHDALQMVSSVLRRQTKSGGVKVPTPGYSVTNPYRI